MTCRSRALLLICGTSSSIENTPLDFVSLDPVLLTLSAARLERRQRRLRCNRKAVVGELDVGEASQRVVVAGTLGVVEGEDGAGVGLLKDESNAFGAAASVDEEQVGVLVPVEGDVGVRSQIADQAELAVVGRRRDPSEVVLDRDHAATGHGKCHCRIEPRSPFQHFPRLQRGQQLLVMGSVAVIAARAAAPRSTTAARGKSAQSCSWPFHSLLAPFSFGSSRYSCSVAASSHNTPRFKNSSSIARWSIDRHSEHRGARPKMKCQAWGIS